MLALGSLTIGVVCCKRHRPARIITGRPVGMGIHQYSAYKSVCSSFKSYPNVMLSNIEWLSHIPIRYLAPLNCPCTKLKKRCAGRAST